MSLGIAFKGPEGIVLAADSRVTLTVQRPIPGQTTPMTIPATFDNARKLLQVNGRPNLGVVTFGAGAIGTAQPRTAHSFLPDFETELGDTKLTVGEFAQKLSDFFLDKWNSLMAGVVGMPDMTFYVAGFDENEPHGRVYEIQIPSTPEPNELGAGNFGIVWGGQREIVDRIIQGFDERVAMIAQKHLGLTDAQRQSLRTQLGNELNLPIPYQFLPLQDCIDLATTLVHTTAQLQSWLLDVRGVGGPVDVATITRTEGFKEVQMKRIVGEGH